MEQELIKKEIENGQCVLGIELGSTRIKSVLIGSDHTPLAEGVFTWENRLENGIWTYSLEDVENGVRVSYADCVRSVKEQYGLSVRRLGGVGISAMMHGYLAFDENDQLLVPFRTWRNTITKKAASELTELFHYNIPQRWSIAHLYQAVLNKEPHVPQVRSLMTLAEYVHWKLTGNKAIGVGDASGMFPINTSTKTYDDEMLRLFNDLPAIQAMPWKLEELLPQPLPAGRRGGTLSQEGCAYLDPTGELMAGAPVCPPEGDAQTGMVATNSVGIRTGNVSAGTSDFAILVLERELSEVYPQIDLITSPTGALAANVHCNNCTTDLNAWVSLFGEFAKGAGLNISTNELYGLLYRKALEGEKDGGGLLAFNYYSGEGITDLDAGRPLLTRLPDAKFNLPNLMRTHLYAALATLKVGMDIITTKEGMQFDKIFAHGGLFKTKEVGQKILAGALNTPITVMETAEQGGAWGMALLAQYMIDHAGRTLEGWLEESVFSSEEGRTISPDPADVEGFNRYLERFIEGLPIERSAVDHLQ